MTDPINYLCKKHGVLGPGKWDSHIIDGAVICVECLKDVEVGDDVIKNASVVGFDLR